MTTDAAPAPSPGRAGRNLPAAIGVGLGLASLVIISLLLAPWGFVPLATLALVIGVGELRSGMAAGHVDVPMVPVVLGTIAMLPAAYLWGALGLTVAFGLTVLGVVGTRVWGGSRGAPRDVSGGIFVATYGPFLASFSSLLLANPDGRWRIFVFILVTVCSDIGGYAAGVLAGKHPMAPSVSPKKSWEGFAGSATACIVAGALSVPLALHGTWWAGAVLGAATVVTATMGDLAESLLKRDLGIKDFGTILPGHGGLMDRLDSLLLVAPVAWWLLAVLVPAT